MPRGFFRAACACILFVSSAIGTAEASTNGSVANAAASAAAAPSVEAAPSVSFAAVFCGPKAERCWGAPIRFAAAVGVGPASQTGKVVLWSELSGLLKFDPSQTRSNPWHARDGRPVAAAAFDPLVTGSIRSLFSARNDAGTAILAHLSLGRGIERPWSPAMRLGLSRKARSKAETCLTQVIYFEARAEPLRGQIAVAQVVMNRVFSRFYPDDVCGVVFQNADRHLACQFSFACDDVADTVTEPKCWRLARRIANDVLDGKLWIEKVGMATHYHANSVHPRWVREMHRLDAIGGHIFYRPRAWGSGADQPVWGNAATTAAVVKTL